MRQEERRLVTCLFIDVVGSTELTVSLGPERLVGRSEIVRRRVKAEY